MGTNYYVKTEQKPPCPTCGHQEVVEPLHIGKSSYGWKFLFAHYPEHGLMSWEAWRRFLADKGIVDEYGEEHPLSHLEELVSAKQEKGITAFTATRDSWGGGDPHDFERLDDEGYRFCTTADFS